MEIRNFDHGFSKRKGNFIVFAAPSGVIELKNVRSTTKHQDSFSISREY